MQINREIKEREVRLIGGAGEQLGVFSTQKALQMAEEQMLDLVKVADSNPPVCKIMDYGKYKFEAAKKEKSSKKRQHAAELKEIRLSARIGDHDLEIKANHAQKFIAEGNKVKVSLRFKGREMTHQDIGRGIMQKFANLCTEFAAVEQQPKMESRSMFMFLAPVKKTKIESKTEPKAANSGEEGVLTQQNPKVQGEEGVLTQQNPKVQDEKS